jgi:hypothetical protein
VFGFDLKLLLAGFAYPVVPAFDEGVVMDSFPVVFRAEITFHETDFAALTLPYT